MDRNKNCFIRIKENILFSFIIYNIKVGAS